MQPLEVWIWDITKLKGLIKWSCYLLYVIRDIIRCYVVAWILSLLAIRVGDQIRYDTSPQQVIFDYFSPVP